MVVREDFAHGLLERVRHRPVREDPVVVAVRRVARGRLPGPLVFVGGVVEDEIDDEADAVRPQLGGKLTQLLHGAQLRVDVAVTGDGVAAVGVRFGGQEQRHQVQIGEAQFLEIGDPGADTLQVLGVPVDIADAAEHGVGLEPAAVVFPFGVEALELGRPLGPRRGRTPSRGP